jgi:hypothetical protein
MPFPNEIRPEDLLTMKQACAKLSISRSLLRVADPREQREMTEIGKKSFFAVFRCPFCVDEKHR